MSPRWKFLNKNISGSPKYSGTRFTNIGEKGNTPFFLMSNSSEKSNYNWRHRPGDKLLEEGAEVIEVIEMAAKDLIEVEDTNVETNDCCENQENVIPGDDAEDGEDEEGEEKWQKKVRNRRGRRKKKIVHVTLPVQA